jgi:hypothetical protein
VLVTAVPPGASAPNLYRLVGNKLELLRAVDPGAATPVFPLVTP